ncbi:MAG TPA: outer membrane lipoprotein-sorting protein [Chthoniobacterales bacterium]|nr:outer membrane lipoprotein-sorting protein [Chthoniobacterales bacterium]
MINRASRLVVIALALVLALDPAVLFAAAPAAKDILAGVRMQQGAQQIEVQGQLRENDTVVPFRLTQSGPVIRYSFTNPDEALQLRIGESDSRLEEITREGVDRVSGGEWEQKVRGTAITYEDLALKFLYWPDARVLGEDYIHTRRVWKIEMTAPARQSRYSKVFVWVTQEGGALLRLHGFDWNGKLAKRFDVVSAQQIEGRWFLKQMRIEELQPDSGKVLARTYLDIKK